MIKKVRNENPDTLALDAGDVLHGTPMMYVFRGEPMTDLINAAGYDIRTLGNHDFEWRIPNLAEHIRASRQEFVESNIVFPPGYDFSNVKPYVIREIGGVRIAVLGVETADVLKYVWPGYIEGVKIETPEEAMERLLPEIRKNADYIVLLSHLGTGRDLQLAFSDPGIDIILGGHSHEPVYPPLRVGKTLIINTGCYGANLGRVDVDFAPDADGVMMPAAVRSSLMPITENIQEDTALLPIYDRYQKVMKRVLTRKVADSWFVGANGDATKAKPGSGDRIAELLRDATGADIAVVGSVLINGEMNDGPVYASDIFNLLRSYSRQNVLLFHLTGAQLSTLIVNSLNSDRNPPQLFFSGMTFDVNREASAGNRIGNVAVEGQPLDDNESYLIAATGNFVMDWTDLLRSGAGGIVDTSETLRDVIAKQLSRENAVDPKSIDPCLNLGGKRDAKFHADCISKLETGVDYHKNMLKLAGEATYEPATSTQSIISVTLNKKSANMSRDGYMIEIEFKDLYDVTLYPNGKYNLKITGKNINEHYADCSVVINNSKEDKVYGDINSECPTVKNRNGKPIEDILSPGLIYSPFGEGDKQKLFAMDAANAD